MRGAALLLLNGLLCTTLASDAWAQDIAPVADRVGLGYRIGRGQQLGLQLQRVFTARGRRYTALEAGAFWTIAEPTPIALAFPSPAIDNRWALALADIGARAGVGRQADARRRWHVHARAGMTVVSWGRGTWQSDVRSRDPHGTRTVVGRAGIGFGRAFGAPRSGFDVEALLDWHFDAVDPYPGFRLVVSRRR